MLFDLDLIHSFYTRYLLKLQEVRAKLRRPLTFTEKILFTHQLHLQDVKRGVDYQEYLPDRVSMQDATAQMALLQLMVSGRKRVAVPTTVHCDHLIQARVGAEKDLQESLLESHEVYQFLRQVSSKYGIGFWRPGAGIIHQVILENYAFPGGLMIGTDSHTPNGGGLGMLSIGVGGADAVDVMAGMPWELKVPKIIGVKLTGNLRGWTASKDIILKVAGLLTVKGGTDAVIEYFGEGARSISCTGKGTITNMGAEVGATTSLFPYDQAMARFLAATGREEVVKALSSCAHELQADRQVEEDPAAYFDQVLEIDLSQLEPHINGPYSPDRMWKISELKEAAHANSYPLNIKVALIGSCTNSSYEDIQRAASIARQAAKYNLKAVCPLTITPGSEQIRATIERDGLLHDLEKIGGLVLANACGPCIGQWKRSDVTYGEKNTIVTSYNRNFSGRNDANPGTHSFVTSPEIVVALALAGNLGFNPLKDTLKGATGEEFRLDPPVGEELPKEGFDIGDPGYEAPAHDGDRVQIIIEPHSTRLEPLTPFKAWDGQDFIALPVLVKAEGKCTTDHISPAGSWLQYRGHLDKISDNCFMGVRNAFQEQIGKGKNQLDGSIQPYSTIARQYKAQNLGWVVIADENYGEGSSREHAAMEPRHLGCKVVIAKSFARIHETNLKKQGILALTFLNKEDYKKVLEDDRISILRLQEQLEQEQLKSDQIKVELLHADGTKERLTLQHSYNQHQLGWFKNGSALNMLMV